MRKLLALVLLYTVHLNAQKFAPGYYIDNSGIKHEGFIEDSNNFNSPEKIFFKSNESDPIQIITIEKVQAFRINANYKFERHNVEFDADQTQIKDETKILGANPSINRKQALLKVLVEGNLVLYKGVFDEVTFYYAKRNTEETPQLLLYRRYFTDEGVRSVNSYQLQLFRLLSTDVAELPKFKDLAYDEDDLVKLITKYNIADNSLSQSKVDKKKYSGIFSKRIFAGTAIAIGDFERANFSPSQDKSSLGNLLIGGEIAYRSGYDFKRYEIYSKLYYNSIQLEGSYSRPVTLSTYGYDGVFKGKINMVNLSVGARYALFNTEKHRLNLGIGATFSKTVSGDFTVKEQRKGYITVDPPTYQIVETNSVIDLKSSAIFFNTGLQYMFNNRYGIEFEFQLPRNYVENGNQPNFKVDVTSFYLSFIYGF
ncbi:hypothetical protein [Flavobacterium stagni]|uniref:Outer membrane protein beta-barrel domain-containing protein n=1 Tax=Flavobacterium stagni TaxID=2506421 RepID=A0A4Q1KD68_9FLAO|nr:hypothetical protein [Flavobacterium stagni]RXR23312.1 hypothetical protein EQG61_04900 [Flavobacterium stagni]